MPVTLRTYVGPTDGNAVKDFPAKSSSSHLEHDYQVLGTSEKDILVARVRRQGQEIVVNIFIGEDDKYIVYNGQASFCNSQSEAIERIYDHFDFYAERQKR